MYIVAHLCKSWIFKSPAWIWKPALNTLSSGSYNAATDGGMMKISRTTYILEGYWRRLETITDGFITSMNNYIMGAFSNMFKWRRIWLYLKHSLPSWCGSWEKVSTSSTVLFSSSRHLYNPIPHYYCFHFLLNFLSGLDALIVLHSMFGANNSKSSYILYHLDGYVEDKYPLCIIFQLFDTFWNWNIICVSSICCRNVFTVKMREYLQYPSW